MKIIDCHTHCYPEELHTDPRAWAEAHHELHWAELVAPAGRPSIQDWATPSRMLADMDAAGVERAVLLGWYWEHEASCRWHNEVIADWVRRAPDRFIGFASVLPNANIVAQLEAARALGLSGIGELHPGVQDFDSESPHWQTMAAWCTAHDWPVNLHATAENGDHPSAVATPLEDYRRMAEQAPELKIILAHWGGGLPWKAQGPLPQNLYFDCSASPLLYDIDRFRTVIQHIGTERILFGSDYPLRIYPRQQKQADMTTYLRDILENSGLSEPALSALLKDNAQELF
ncbi:MAG: amidohydrolase family protein [Opitutales bacterium]